MLDQRTAACWTCRRWGNTRRVGEMLDELQWPSLLFFHKIQCGIMFIDKNKYLTCLREQDPPGHRTTHSIAGPRLIVMPWSILFSQGLFPIGIVWLQLWSQLTKMVCIISNFLVLHFGENFLKIRTKIAKLQIHENLHKKVNENMFSFTFLLKFSWVLWRAIKVTNMLQLYTANFNLLLKMATIFPNFDGPNVFFPNSTGPWSRFQNRRKIPVYMSLYLDGSLSCLTFRKSGFPTRRIFRAAKYID